MRAQLTSFAAMGALLAGLACSKNLDNMAKPDESAVKRDSTSQTTSGYKGGERDTTLNGAADSAKARPDQGEPVTAKGDTLNPGTGTNPAPSGNVGVDTTAHPPMDTTSRMRTDSMPSMGTDSMPGMSTDTSRH